MKDQELQDFNETVANLENNILNSSLIQDNKLIFPLENGLFRVRMPNQLEQSKAESYRNKKYIEMVSSGECATEEKLIANLKNSGVVDIGELRNQKEKITKELEDVYINLAVRLSTEKKAITTFKEQCTELSNKIKELSIKISEYLIPTLENQLEKVYMERITSLCTEKCAGKDNWIAIWEEFEDFQKADPKLTDSAMTYMTWLLLNSKG